MNVQRLHELVETYLEEKSTADEQAELESLLRNHPEAREYYWSEIWFHIEVQSAIAVAAGASAVQPSSESGGAADAAALQSESRRKRGPIQAALTAFAHTTWQIANRNRVMLGLAAALLLGILVTSLLLNENGARAVDHSAIAQRPFAARLTMTHAAVWGRVAEQRATEEQRAARNAVHGTSNEGAIDRDPQTLESNTDLYVDDRMYLKSGWAEIYFAKGTVAVLEGPAVLTIGGNNFCTLDTGKLVARITTPEAKGFTVRTGLMSITDLGTEFGVVAGRGVDVNVFRGEVQVSPTPASSKLEEDSPPPITTINEGQMAHVAPESPNVVVANTSPAKDSFVRPEQLRQRIADEYGNRVRNLKPVAYWRMEGGDVQSVTNAIGDANHGTLQLGPKAVAPWEPGEVGNALRLRGPMSRDCALVADYPVSHTGKITVAAWVEADVRPQWAMIAANWGHRAKTGQFHFGLYGNEGDLEAQITQANGKWLAVREGAGSRFPLGRWQHVAFVADGTRLRLFRNGKEIASRPYDGTLLASPPAGMGIGCKLADEGTTPFGMYWQGMIDELVIFHRALTADEIGQLARIFPASN